MQREAEEREPRNAVERYQGLRLRCHPSAERFAAGDEHKLRREPARLGDGRAHRRMRDLRRVRPFAAVLHGGKLIAQGRDAALGELGRDRSHERMGHSGPRAMREHEAGGSAGRDVEQAGNARLVMNGERDRLRRCFRHFVCFALEATQM